MTFYVENETDVQFDFDAKELVKQVAEAVLDSEGCPYETQVNVLITDNEGIHEFNIKLQGYRQGNRCSVLSQSGISGRGCVSN